MKVLVTLDGSSFSEAILGAVARLAGPAGADVELLAVAEPKAARATPAGTPVPELAGMVAPSGTRLTPPAPAELLPPVVESRAQALARMEAALRGYLAAQAPELPACRVATRVVFDADVAGAIVAHARRSCPDLIAMATHGRTGLMQRLAGGVTERVIRSGVAPVLVLRP